MIGMFGQLPSARVVRDELAGDPLEIELQDLAKSQARRTALASLAFAMLAAAVGAFAWHATVSAEQTRAQLPGQPGDFETFVADFLWVWAAASAIAAGVLARRAISARRGNARAIISP
jgi:hypothetical protein